MNHINKTYEELCRIAPAEEPARQQFFIERCRELLDGKERDSASPAKTFHIETYGCQMNAKDSEKLSGILKKCGMQETDSEQADLVLYNTCTVRENANQKVYGHLGYVHSLKKKNPGMMVALCGCMMQDRKSVV